MCSAAHQLAPLCKGLLAFSSPCAVQRDVLFGLVVSRSGVVSYRDVVGSVYACVGNRLLVCELFCVQIVFGGLFSSSFLFHVAAIAFLWARPVFLQYAL